MAGRGSMCVLHRLAPGFLLASFCVWLALGACTVAYGLGSEDANAQSRATASLQGAQSSPMPRRSGGVAFDVNGVGLTCPQAAARLEQEEYNAWRSHPSNVLSPFTLTQGCVASVGTGYWGVEVCPGRWIRQFTLSQRHVERENFLGLQRNWEGDGDRGTAVTEPLVLYADGQKLSIPERIRSSREIPQGDALQDALRTLETRHDVNAERAVAERLPTYACSVTDHGFVEVTAEYTAGSFCAKHNVYRSSKLHMVCDMRRYEPLVVSYEPKPCRYEVFLVARFLCDLMGADVSGSKQLPQRLQSDSHGRQVWRHLNDADLVFSL